MASKLEVKIQELSKSDNGHLKGQDVTVEGYLIGKAEEPLDDGYNYPFIDENMNGILVKSKTKLDDLVPGKWFNVTGKLDSTHQQEMYITSATDINETKRETTPPTTSRQFSSSVKKIVDGDTIHLEKPVLGTTKVRFVSIDTPETNYQGDTQGYYAEEATRQLKYLCSQ